LYRDYYKTTGTVLQPNSPKGKEYLKDAGYGKTTPVVADNNGGPPPILPIKPQAASVNEPLDSDTATVTVDPLIRITTQPTNRQALIDTDTNFSVVSNLSDSTNENPLPNEKPTRPSKFV